MKQAFAVICTHHSDCVGNGHTFAVVNKNKKLTKVVRITIRLSGGEELTPAPFYQHYFNNIGQHYVSSTEPIIIIPLAKKLYLL